MSRHIKKVTLDREFIPFEKGESFEFKEGINFLVGDQGVGKSTLILLIMNAGEGGQQKVGETEAKRLHAHYTAQDKPLPNGVEIEYDELGKPKDAVMSYDNKFSGIVSLEGNNLGRSFFIDMEHHNPRTMDDVSGSRLEMAYLGKFMNYVDQECDYADFKKTLSELLKDYQNLVGTAKDMDQIVQSRFKSHGEVTLPMLGTFKKAKDAVIYLDEPESALSIKSQYKLRNVLEMAVKNGCQLFICTHSPILMKMEDRVLSLEHKKWMDTDEFIETQEEGANQIIEKEGSL